MAEPEEKSGTQSVLRDIPESEETETAEDEEKNLLFDRLFGDRAHYGVPEYFAIHLEGARDHYLQKGKWSRFLMRAIGGMILFQSGLLLLVGLGWLDFTPYDWLLPVLLVQNLGQIVGLALYAVRYLFSDISDQIPEPARSMEGNST